VTIKTKLIALLIAFSLTLAGAMAMITYNQNFNDRIDKDLKALEDLYNTLVVLQGDILKMNMISFVEQYNQVQEDIEKATEAYDRVENLQVITGLSDDIVKYLESIGRLEALMMERADGFRMQSENIMEALEEQNIMIRGLILSDLTISGRERYNDRDLRYTFYLIDNYYNNLLNFSEVISTNHVVVQRQREEITRVVDNFERSFMLVTIGVSAFLFILVFSIGMYTMISISRNIRILMEGIHLMTSGDLTQRIHIKSRDELYHVANNLNIFQDNLTDTMKEVFSSSEQNLTIKNDLVAAVTETSAASVQMDSNVNSIKNQISSLDENINQSRSNTDDVLQEVASLKAGIETQSAMVEQATAAVTEMIANIASVAELTKKSQSITQELVSTASTGGERIASTAKDIDEIGEFVQDINGMTSIIQKIAAQTNLLAMNAAIEAAHAGEFGRGFGVVADEIRTLAEASSTNSKQITQTLKAMSEKMAAASESGSSTKAAFNEISDKVNGVSRAFGEISSATGELNEGGTQILQAMTKLEELSRDVNSGTQNMNSKATGVSSSMEQVGRISMEVLNGAMEISTAIREVAHSMEDLNNLAGSLSQVSENLNDQVNTLKVAKEEDLFQEIE